MKNLFKLCLTVFLATHSVSAQTGGQFVITQSVSASVGTNKRVVNQTDNSEIRLPPAFPRERGGI